MDSKDKVFSINQCTLDTRLADCSQLANVQGLDCKGKLIRINICNTESVCVYKKTIDCYYKLKRELFDSTRKCV